MNLLPYVNGKNNIPATDDIANSDIAISSNTDLFPVIDDISYVREPIKNIIGGVYTNNITLFFRNSPYRVEADLVIETNAILTVETGVKIYFDPGVGIKIKGAIWAMVNIIN
uniref:Uncharacterized protein n=1 Tax=Setaria digitata TaxID=48799 RepID=A0A915PR28_9BILA